MKSVLKYPRDYYIPSTVTIAKALTMSQVRKEYTRLRAIANKRLKRLGESEFKTSEIFKKNKQGFPKLSELESERAILHEFSRIAFFLESKTSTVSGQRSEMNEAIKTLHGHGYDFVTRQNFNQFADFMEQFRTEKLNKIYDSDQPAKLLELVEEGIAIKDIERNFEFYVANQRNISKILSDDKVSLKEAKKKISNLKRSFKRKQKRRN